MPDCLHCAWLDGRKCGALEVAELAYGRPIPPAPIGACTVARVEEYLPQISAGMKVLEVGCGTWSRLKEHCLKVRAEYTGIDTAREYYGKPTVATHQMNLRDISFKSETFDFVIGNQTMEH